MDEVARLVAIEDIKQLKARYFRFVDTKDWNGWRTVFTPDVHIDISDDVPNGTFEGADALIALSRESLADAVSIHHGYCPEIEITSDSTARAIWAMDDRLRWNAGSAHPGREIAGYGHYHETYEKRDGVWRISRMRLTRLRTDLTPGSTQ